MLIKKVWEKVVEYLTANYDIDIYHQSELRFAYVVYVAYLNSTDYILMSQSKRLLKEAYNGYVEEYGEVSQVAFDRSVYRVYVRIINDMPIDFMSLMKEMANSISV